MIIYLKCEPDEKYTYQGANLLVDGLQGDDNYRSGRYIGLYGQKFDAIIDLQETKEISAQLQISVAYFCSIGLYFLV